MKYATLTLLFTIILSSSLAFAQEEILEYVDEQSVSIATEHSELLEKIRAKPQTKSVHLATIADAQNIKQMKQLLFNVPEGEPLSIHRDSFKSMSEEQARWTGNIKESISEAQFLISGNTITGMIRSKNQNYDINPLRGTRYHVIVEIDPSKFEKESPPMIIEPTEKSDSSEGESSTGYISSNMLTTPEIDILVAYTTEAKNDYSGNMSNLITLAEGNMNDAFTTSGIDADINVVHTVEVDYDESWNDDLNLCRLTTSEVYIPNQGDCPDFTTGQLNGYMDNIHDLRYQYDANLVVLITGDGPGPGIDWQPAINSKYGFSVLRYDMAASQHTFSHEVGHNLGAAHNPAENDPEVYPYGHGYVYHPSKWNTIMAYRPDTTYTRINRYSTPNKTFAGVVTGTAQYEDNARAINNRTSLVAGFDPPPTLPKVSISGPTTVNINDTETWYSNRTGGVSPFSYSWYSSTNGGSSWNLIGTSANYTGSFSTATTTKLKVVVTDDNSETDQDIMDVIVTDGGCIICKVANLPQEFALNQNYPNPFNPSTQIKYALPEQADVSIRVYNIMGQQVVTLVNTNMSAGFHEVNFDAGNLASGVYLTRMEAIGQSGEQFSEELKMQLIK